MKDKMNKKHSEICKLLLNDPEAIYPPTSHDTVVLEERQWEELDRIRKEIRKLCESGKDEEAEAVARQAERIVSEGPPAREG